MIKKLIFWFVVIVAVVVFPACKESRQALFTTMTAEETGVNFANTITESDSINALSYYYCYNGGGVGIGDFNNDGLPDIFFSGNMVSSKLYLNKGEMQFEDVTEMAGLTTRNWIMGVSLVDINNDGWMDIYLNVAGPGRTGHSNLLYINQGKGQGDISFKEEAYAYGLADSSFCVQSAFLDYDRDGDLDMYLLINKVDGVEKTFINPASYPVTRGVTVDRLYENTGDSAGHPYFKDVSAQAGITAEGYGLGLAVGDLNEDGWPDVYAANDFMPNDHLLINQKNKTFKDLAAAGMRHQTYNGMGVDIADINNDLKPDIMVLDMLPEINERKKTMIARADNESFIMKQQAGYVDQYMRNTLQLNRGTDHSGITHFSDIAQLSGLHATDWSWSVLLADFDNDGFCDSYVTNGFAKNITDLDFSTYNADNNLFGTSDDKLKKTNDLLGKLKGIYVSNYIFRNNGGLVFDNMTTEWGLNKPSYSNGAAYADLDNDGDLDLVTSNINEKAFVHRNNAEKMIDKNNFLRVVLHGSEKNINGTGATLHFYCGTDKFYHYYSPVKGYLSSTTGPVSLGLGKHESVDSVRIIWPDGNTQLLKNVRVNQTLKIDYHSSQSLSAQLSPDKSIFSSVNDRYNIRYRHSENEYNDFNYQQLLHRLYSRKGPSIAVADIDKKNGLDFFIGGSVGNSGTLFTQDNNGKFSIKQIGPQDKKSEDMGALFFDADNDGDEDLYIVNGGSESMNLTGNFQDHLYLNDGKGNFMISSGLLPETLSGGSCIVGADFDKDGDIDLFRAGGNSFDAYNNTPISYLLQNENGKFIDNTEKLAPQLKYAGMVTSAVWSDFDNDDWVDLIVTGEWMAPVFYKNQQGVLKDVTGATGLENINGWWNSIFPADIDNDGDMDYVVGNMGTNIDYSPSKNYPMELYYGVFSGSTKPQPVISYYSKNENGDKKTFPFAFRDDLFKAMPSLKKRFPDYSSYGKATLNEVFRKEELVKAKHYRADVFESAVLINSGNGKFIFKSLPVEAQFSSIYGILPLDVDEDGNMDLIVAGNSHSSEVVYGWMDASLGILLKGDGKGNFTSVTAPSSGLFLHGDMKSLALMYDKDHREMILAAANSDSLKVLSNTGGEVKKVFYADRWDAYANIFYRNGTTSKQEFYFGSGYLSQSVRAISISGMVMKIEVADTKGNRRTVEY